MTASFHRSCAPCALLILSSAAALAAPEVEVIRETNHGVSAPLRTLPYEPLAAPLMRPRLSIGPTAAAVASQQEDPVLQEVAGPLVNTTPGLNFPGLGKGFVGPNGTFTVQFAPPDTNIAVGATQVVEMVNLSYAVFDKTTGTAVAGPISINKLWTGVDTSCSTANNLSDPVVLYDQLAGRWVVEIITTSSPYKFCWAVSTTSDATGTYHAYAFVDSAGLPDYAKIGMWSDAYYLSARQFNASLTAFLGPKACAADRTSMLAGLTATLQCFQDSNTSVDGMLPSSLDGATAPPAGRPNFFMLIPLPDSGTATSLQMFKFHVDFAVPTNSTFTGPTVISVPSYTEASSFGGFVPQQGTSTKLDGLGFTLMNRMAYRRFTGTTPHEALVLTHNVSTSSGTTKRYAPRWYEIRGPNNATPFVYQSGTFSPDTTYRWAASIAMDKVGDIALGYSASSSTIHPSIRYTGRNATDAKGTMQAEAIILTGVGSQTANLTRWGDYSSMVVDPVDDCTMWYAQEDIPANGSFNWSTQLASFKFTACQ